MEYKDVKPLLNFKGKDIYEGIYYECENYKVGDVTYTAVCFFSVEDVIKIRFVNAVDANISEYKFDKDIEDKLTLTGNINAEKTTAKLNALEELHKEAMRRLSDYAVTFAIAVSKNGSES